LAKISLIKNKLVTAVTTAGLLAGLFGSAFVPAARAAADDATQTLATAAASASDATYAYYKTSVYPVFTVAIDPDAGDDDTGTYEVSVAGATIRSCTIAAGGATVGSVVATSTKCSVSITVMVNANTPIWTVTLNKLTAGQIVTIAVADDGAATLTGIASGAKKLRGIAAADLSTLSATETVLTADTTGTSLVTTVAALWTMDWDAAETAVGATTLPSIAIDPKNKFGDDPALYGLATATATGPLAVALTQDSNCENVDSAEFGATSTVLADTAFAVCFMGKNGDTTDAGVGTITVSSGGVTIVNQKINVLGDATSIVLTQNMKHFAVGAELDGTADLNVAKIAYKDAAGNTLTAASYDASVEFSIGGVVTALVDAGTDANFEDTHGSVAGYISLSTICTGKVSGDTVKIDLEYENYDEDVVTGSFTMTCTDADGKITNIKMAASAANPGSDVKVNMTVVDSKGRLCGYGCTIPSATLVTRTPAGTAVDESTDTLTENLGEDELDETHLTGALFGANLVDGTAWVKIQTPSTKGTYAAIIDYADIETGGAVALPGSWTIRLVSSDVAAAPSSTGLTRSAKKLVATADFGATAGGAKIAFTLERSNGTVKTYYRKANADGVATFRLRFSGKYEVTASFGDYITDTVILRRR
jgi:hypothetical protein